MTHRFLLAAEKRDERSKYIVAETPYQEPPTLYRQYYPINREPDIAFKALIKIGPAGELTLDHNWPLLSFRIHELTGRFDCTPVRFHEADGKLFVDLQDFICEAKVAVGVMHKHDASWQFGFVTAAAAYRVTGKYAKRNGDGAAPLAEAQCRGRAEWELPCALISCSDAAHAPWHGGARSKVLRGPADAQNVELALRCRSECTPPPHSFRLETPEGAVELFKVEIMLKYFTWFVMKNAVTGTVYVVRTLVWTRALDVNVHAAEKEASQRASVARDFLSSVEATKNWPLPERTLSAPFVAQELTLKWYPAYSNGKRPLVLSGPDRSFTGYPRMPTT